MLVQLNTGKIISLDSVSSIDVKGTKIYYTLNNNIVVTELFDSIKEVQQRLKQLFNFNYVLDKSGFDKAKGTADNILGE